MYGNRWTKKEILGSIDPDKSKIVARNTVWYKKGDVEAIKLYGTTLVEKHPDKIIIRDGNYTSNLTTHRLNFAFQYLKIPFNAWRYGAYGCYAIYVVSHDQMVPINGAIEWNGEFPERSCSADSYLRRVLWYTHNHGMSRHPLYAEWDGRASTLRKMMCDWRSTSVPLSLLPPGTIIQTYKPNYYRDPVLRHKLIKNKIKIRDKFEAVLFAGHIDNLRKETK